VVNLGHKPQTCFSPAPNNPHMPEPFLALVLSLSCPRR
jgi:hypothetical protein